MLKITGTVLVIFACAALGYGKSAGISARLFLLREIEKLLLLLMGEITYRKEALPEAMLRVSEKIQELKKVQRLHVQRKEQVFP